jgi:hypothetical protein
VRRQPINRRKKEEGRRKKEKFSYLGEKEEGRKI